MKVCEVVLEDFFAVLGQFVVLKVFLRGNAFPLSFSQHVSHVELFGRHRAVNYLHDAPNQCTLGVEVLGWLELF